MIPKMIPKKVKMKLLENKILDKGGFRTGLLINLKDRRKAVPESKSIGHKYKVFVLQN